MPRQKLFFFLAAILFCSFVIFKAWAVEEDKATIKYSYYNDNRSIYFDNADGITVQSPTILLNKKLSDNLTLHVKASLDAISAASRKIDAVTTASPNARMEKRAEGNVGFSYLFKRLTTFDFGFGYSGENDYNSKYGYVSAAHEMFNKNTTVNVAYVHNSDRIETTRIGDTRNFPQGRQTDSYTLSFSQILSRTTIAAVGYNYLDVRGYMGVSQNVVQLSDGVYADEQHPRDRNRNAAIFRINQYIVPTRSAIHLSYRYYFDDWSVNSHDIGIKLYQYLTEELILRLRYRYYDQSSAFFWYDNPVPGQQYTTWDGRLKNIQANLFGMKFIYDVTGLTEGTFVEKLFKNTEVDLVWDRYYQNTGFNYNLYQAGLTVKF
jgi:hypothetical protein